MECDVLHEILKIFGASHKIGLAIDFQKDADFSVTVNIGCNNAFCSRSARLFLRLAEAFFAEPFNGFFHIAAGFGQGFLTVHHAGPGFFSQVADGAC